MVRADSARTDWFRVILPVKADPAEGVAVQVGVGPEGEVPAVEAASADPEAEVLAEHRARAAAECLEEEVAVGAAD